MEKTRITAVEEGFDFLGYRVVQEKSRRTGDRVGKLFIPKSKLKDLRYKTKGKVRETPPGEPLAELINNAQPHDPRLAKRRSLRRRSQPGLRGSRLVDASSAYGRWAPEEVSQRRSVA